MICFFSLLSIGVSGRAVDCVVTNGLDRVLVVAEHWILLIDLGSGFSSIRNKEFFGVFDGTVDEGNLIKVIFDVFFSFYFVESF